MDNCYNCKNLVVKCRSDYKGYEVHRTTDCEHCDMRIKNHATKCDYHKEGNPRVVWKR